MQANQEWRNYARWSVYVWPSSRARGDKRARQNQLLLGKQSRRSCFLCYQCYLSDNASLMEASRGNVANDLALYNFLRHAAALSLFLSRLLRISVIWLQRLLLLLFVVKQFLFWPFDFLLLLLLHSHAREPGQIYVANHTSVIDVVRKSFRCTVLFNLFSLTQPFFSISTPFPSCICTALTILTD
jgi:hypothetical protein